MKILLDLFPAHFQLTTVDVLKDVHELEAYPPSKNRDIYYLSITRVVVTDEIVAVAQDTPEGAVIVFQERYETFEKPTEKDGTYRIVTASNKMLAFKKDTNCGCGSRLRSWNPYKTLTA